MIHTSLRRVFRMPNIPTKLSWSIMDQVIVSGCNFLMGLLLARLLGLEDFGVFTLFWSILLLTVGVQTSIIIYPMLTLGPKMDDRKAEKYYIASFYHQIFFSILSVITVILLGQLFFYINEDTMFGYLIFPLAAAVGAVQLQEFLRKFQHATLSPERAFLNDLVSHGGKIFMLSYFYIRGQLSVELSLWVMTGTSAIGFLFFIRDLPFCKVKYDLVKTHLDDNWRFSVWLLPASLVQWLTGNIFLFLGGGLLSPTAVGAIKSAQNIMGITHVFFQALENYLPARTARLLITSGFLDAKRYVINAGMIGLILVVSFSFLVMRFHEYFFVFIYGDDFGKYSNLLFWYAIAYPFIYISIIMRIWARTLEKTKLILEAYIIMALVACITGFPLAYYAGAEGIMFGLLVTHLVMVITLYYELRILKLDSELFLVKNRAS